MCMSRSPARRSAICHQPKPSLNNALHAGVSPSVESWLCGRRPASHTLALPRQVGLVASWPWDKAPEPPVEEPEGNLLVPLALAAAIVAVSSPPVAPAVHMPTDPSNAVALCHRCLACGDAANPNPSGRGLRLLNGAEERSGAHPPAIEHSPRDLRGREGRLEGRLKPRRWNWKDSRKPVHWGVGHVYRTVVLVGL